MKPMRRRERRAERQRRFVAAREASRGARLDYGVSRENGARRETDYGASLPGWLRPLDYKVSGGSGAQRVPSKVSTWHLGGRANGHAPPPGQGWDGSGSAYVVAAGGTRLVEPIIHHRWRRLTAEQTAANTDG